MNYEWKIVKMVVTEDASETVIGASWECHGIIDEFDFVISGFQTIPLDNDKKFIKYANLTENTVANWVKENLGEKRVNDIQKDLFLMYSKRSELPVENNLPWE